MYYSTLINVTDLNKILGDVTSNYKQEMTKDATQICKIL